MSRLFKSEDVSIDLGQVSGIAHAQHPNGTNVVHVFMCHTAPMVLNLTAKQTADLVAAFNAHVETRDAR